MTVQASAAGTASPEWALLVDEISRCTRCPLHQGRIRTVVYRGATRPRILFVGEAPGADEDRAGLPFVGRSGRRLDQAIELLGLRAEDFGIVNLVKCRPPDNRFDLAAGHACQPYLVRQLALLAPERIVTLGAHALRTFDPSAARITEAAGHPRSTSWGPVFPMLHPAAALHAPSYAERWASDLTALAIWLKEPVSQTS